MYDVSLYGHLTIDRIFINFKERRTLGAIANVWEALIKLNYSLNVCLNPTAVGEAIILVDKQKGTRQGRGLLNIKTNKVSCFESKWHHIAYLNQLEDTSFIKDIKDGVISADITSGNLKNLDILKYVDYLFISDEDLFMPIDELSSLVKGWVILHFPGGSIATNGDETHKVSIDIINNLNVLGAGDYFAASFIDEALKNKKQNMLELLKNSHSKTTNILKEKNEQ